MIRHGLGIKLVTAESHSPPILELQKNTINSHSISLQSQIHKTECVIKCMGRLKQDEPSDVKPQLVLPYVAFCLYK